MNERNESGEQNAMDYWDQVFYENYIDHTPQYNDRVLCLANNQVIALGDMVWWEAYGIMGRVERIQHIDRFGGYDIITIETQRSFIKEAMADEVVVMTKGTFGYSIPF